MRKLALAALALGLAAAPAFAKGSHATKGYVKKNGIYVAPSGATNPDKTKANNFDQKGNVNPYSGKAGTKK